MLEVTLFSPQPPPGLQWACRGWGWGGVEVGQVGFGVGVGIGLGVGGGDGAWGGRWGFAGGGGEVQGPRA